MRPEDSEKKGEGFIVAAGKSVTGSGGTRFTHELTKGSVIIVKHPDFGKLTGKVADVVSDTELVLAVARRNGYWALKFCAPQLKANKEVVLAAVKQSGSALQHASQQLQGDREVVLAIDLEELKAMAQRHLQIQQPKEGKS